MRTSNTNVHFTYTNIDNALRTLTFWLRAFNERFVGIKSHTYCMFGGWYHPLVSHPWLLHPSSSLIFQSCLLFCFFCFKFHRKCLLLLILLLWWEFEFCLSFSGNQTRKIQTSAKWKQNEIKHFYFRFCVSLQLRQTVGNIMKKNCTLHRIFW